MKAHNKTHTKRGKSKQGKTYKKTATIKPTISHLPDDLKKIFPSKALSKKSVNTPNDKLSSNESIDYQLPCTSSPYEAIAQYPYNQTCYRMEMNSKVYNYISLYPSMNAELMTATGLQKSLVNTGLFNIQAMEGKRNFFQNYHGSGFN